MEGLYKAYHGVTHIRLMQGHPPVTVLASVLDSWET